MDRNVDEMVKYQRCWNKPNKKDNGKVVKELEPSVRDSVESRKKGKKVT